MSRLRTSLQMVLFPVLVGIRQWLQHREERQFYDLMHKITIALNGSLDLAAVIDQVLTSAQRMVAYQTADVRIIDGENLHVLGTRGFNDYFTAAPFDVPIHWRDFPLMREVYEMGRVAVVQDTRTDPRWKADPPFHWIRAHLKVPIKLGGGVIGFLNLDSNRPGFFTPRHARWMQVFADQAAVAIRNAQLYAAEHEQRLLNEALNETAALLNRTLVLSEVFDNILHIVDKVVPHEASNIMLVEGGVTRTISARGYEKYQVTEFVKALSFSIEETGDFRKVISDKQVSVMPDTHADPNWKAFPELAWVRSHLKAPILIDGQVIGFLHLDSTEPHFFTEKHVQTIRTFAEQSAVAIKNARLYAELDRERARLEAILDATGEGILYLEDGLIQYANRAFIQMTEGSEVLNRSFLDFLELLREEKQNLQEQMTHDLQHDGQFYRRDLLLKRRKDDAFYIDMTAALVNEKNPQSVVIMVRDMSQEKRLQLRQSRFITHAAHELRHPLANFMTRLYLLRRKPEEMEEHLNRLDETTQRMTDIIEDMLMVSQFGQGQVTMNPTLISIQEAIGQALLEKHELADDLHVQVESSLPDDPLYAVLDRTLFIEMVGTLVVNAITSGGEKGRVGLRLWQEEAEAVLQITDSGLPLPEEQQEQFFEPFHRPSAGRVVRTGLELTIAEYIVTQHKGRISIQSDRTGNTVTVWLPLG